MDSNGTPKVSTWMVKGIINLIKAPFIPEGCKEKGRWNCCLQEKVARAEAAATSGQNHSEDLFWKEQDKKKHP